MIDLEAIKARCEQCQHGILDRKLYDDIPALIAEVERLQRLADARLEEIGQGIQDEQEACARIAKERTQMWDDRNNGIIEKSHRAEAFEIWDLIRARGNR